MVKKSVKPQKTVIQKGFSKKEAINFGFELAKKNLFFFIVLFIITLGIAVIIGGLRLSAIHAPFVSFVIWLVQTVIDLVIGIGLIHISLKLIDKKKTVYKDLFYYKPIVNYFLASILTGLIVLGGLILLIIPGIIFGIRLKYACYLIIDKNLSPVGAIKQSWKMTKGNVWNLFFFGILLGLINILGFFCLIVGLFVTVPLSMLATAFVYRRLLLQSKAA
jgi:membrane-anchored glycerophosphoryl diester phosphodiesterase (GDPDase)